MARVILMLGLCKKQRNVYHCCNSDQFIIQHVKQHRQQSESHQLRALPRPSMSLIIQNVPVFPGHFLYTKLDWQKCFLLRFLSDIISIQSFKTRIKPVKFDIISCFFNFSR